MYPYGYIRPERVKQTLTNPTQETSSIIEPSTKSDATISDEIGINVEDVPVESSISKKLRRSCRPSISGRKKLLHNARKQRAHPLTNELTQTISANAESSTIRCINCCSHI
ncbi:unnamed protein product [Rotaria magnacalcarata]